MKWTPLPVGVRPSGLWLRASLSRKAKLWSSVKRAYASLYQQLWWLDVIYPFVLSAVLFTGLTYLVYNGQKHRRLASQMEEKFIGFSLRVASPRPLVKPGQIATVNLRHVDLKFLPHIIKTDFTDVTPETYASIIEKLFYLQVKYIVVSWRLGFDSDHESWAKLEAVLARTPAWTRVIFAIPATLKKSLPNFIFENTTVVENAPCQPNTQLICMYGAHWDDWIIQTMANDFWLERDLSANESMISFNLPRVQPSYLLYLNSPSAFESYTFSQLLFLDPDVGKLKDKAVFVGNDLPQGKPGMSKPEDILKVPTALTQSGVDVRQHGTSFHEYWAQIAQLFIDQDLIDVVPYQWSLTVAILFAAFIVFFLNMFGPPVALGLFLSCAAVAPLLNALFIAFWRFYLPLFDLIYAGFWSFIAVTFGQLSIESFKAWQLSIQQRNDQDATDSKSNFISLISHNLNTPVAKMQGLLDILLQLPIDAKAKNALCTARKEVAHIQLIIRCALVLTAIEDRSLSHEPLSCRVIGREFEQMMKNPLGQIGISVRILLEEKSELIGVPLRFDKRALCTSIGALLLFAHREPPDRKCSYSCTFRVSDQDDHQRPNHDNGLECTLVASESTFTDVSHLADTKSNQASHSVLQEMSANLVHCLLQCYDGTIRRSEDGKTIQMMLFPMVDY